VTAVRTFLSWAAFALLTLFSVFMVFMVAAEHPHPLWRAVCALVGLLTATALMFPPVWRGRSYGIARVLVALALALGALLLPMQTHMVKLDMPRPHAAP
jgi:hypothetical protein